MLIEVDTRQNEPVPPGCSRNLNFRTKRMVLENHMVTTRITLLLQYDKAHHLTSSTTSLSSSRKGSTAWGKAVESDPILHTPRHPTRRRQSSGPGTSHFIFRPTRGRRSKGRPCAVSSLLHQGRYLLETGTTARRKDEERIETAIILSIG